MLTKTVPYTEPAIVERDVNTGEIKPFVVDRINPKGQRAKLIKEVKVEAVSRVREDGQPRVIYCIVGAKLDIGLLFEDDLRNPLDYPIWLINGDGTLERCVRKH